VGASFRELFFRQKTIFMFIYNLILGVGSRLPALLLALCAGCNLTAYAIEFATFAIYFKQVHKWNEAAWTCSSS